MNWLALGYELARLLITSVFSVVLVSFLFRRYIAPDFVSSMEEAQEVITNLAKLGGLKSQEFKDTNKLGKLVGADLIKQRIPELEAIKLLVGGDTWEAIEEMIEENPEAVVQMYEKYKHLLPGASQTSDKYDF